jgi:arylsulfatase A-like enzyme
MKQPRQPNLLLLWSDQHRADVMPGPENTVIRAPHLARLAQESFAYRRAYCTSPVCTPSRGSILTGLWPHHHGAVTNNVPLRADVGTIADGLPAEYLTAYFGKWHLGDELRPQHGFQEWRSIEDDYRKYYSNPEDRAQRSDYHHFLVREGFPPDKPDSFGHDPVFSRTFAAGLAEPFTKASYLAGEAEAFLAARRDGRPFVLSVNTLEPHPPTYGPLNRLHDPATIPTGPAFAQPVGADASRHHQDRAQQLRQQGYKNHPIATAADWRRLRANYYGLVTLVDNMVGRVLAALEGSGQAENTIVVYTSDHGDMLGDHGLAQKGVFYEEAVRVPLLLRVPWLTRSRGMITQPFSQIDLAATLRDLMGAPPPNSGDGLSRVSELARPVARDAVVMWTDRENPAKDGRSIITPDEWKLNLYHDDAPELYHFATDRAELHNLGREPAQLGRINELTGRVRQWQQAHGDSLPLVG